MVKYLKVFSVVLIATYMVSCSNDDPGPISGITANDLSVTIDENPTNGDVLGTISASTSQGTLSFSFTNQSPANAMAVDEETGQLTVADESLFDFETNPSLTGTVSITNGINVTGVSVTITLNDVREFEQSTFWRGDVITFSKADGANPNNEANQDQMTNTVWITRGNDGGQIYNIAMESQATQNTSPMGTEWAEGTFDNIEELTFEPFRPAVGRPSDVVGKDLVLHLIDDDIYLEVRFTSWSSGRQGGFSYQRSTE